MSEQNSGIFDLDGALDRLAARVCCEIKSKQRRKRATDEFRGHLEDAIDDIMRQGIPPEKAYAELEESLGSTDKLSTLMASVHNKHHFPMILPWLAGAVVIGGLAYLYLTTENDYLQAWSGFGLQLIALTAIFVLLLLALKWGRAISKRAKALKRLKAFVKKHNGTLICRENGYKSLFVRTTSPELIVDIGNHRYILAMWATVKRHRTLHLQDNGIYSYDKNFGYMFMSPGIAPYSRSTFWRLKGRENDPLLTFYHSEMIKLPEGAHLMPEVKYEECFSPEKINVPVFLLNPIPMNVEICENSHIHKLVDGDTLPASLGSAKLYSMSSLISMMERTQK